MLLQLLAIPLLAVATAAVEPPAGTSFETVRVAEGVYAFVPPVSSSGVVTGNSVAIVGEDGVLVVDSGRFPTLTRRMIAEIRRLTPLPVRYLAHTHWHADHVLTDGEYVRAFPGVVILATDFTRGRIAVNAPKDLRETTEHGPAILRSMRDRLRDGRRRDGGALTTADRASLESVIADVETMVSEMALIESVPLPQVTFERTLTVHLGAREVRLAFLGRGNTAGDTVVHVPDAKVVVTGDLLVLPTPYGHGAYPGEWIETLNSLIAIDAAAIVPGHGPVQRDWGAAKRLVSLLRALRSDVQASVRAGQSLEATRARVRLPEQRRELTGGDPRREEAFDAFFLQPAVARAYEEATGAFTEEGSVSPK